MVEHPQGFVVSRVALYIHVALTLQMNIKSGKKRR